jgi:hydrogenase nickel incorporation protein HypA/HybF
VHEFAIARQLLRTVEAEARRAGAERVVRIHLRLGERSHVSTEALRSYLDLLGIDGCAHGAALEVEREPMRFCCSSCRRSYPVRGADFRCPDCRTLGRLLDPGDQLVIERLEVTP